MTTLVQSRLRGVANLEDATGVSFRDLYRRWSVALYMSGLDPADLRARNGGYRSIDVRSPACEWTLAGPRPRRLSQGAATDSWEATGTSSHYVLIPGGQDSAVEIAVSGPPEAELQVTAVPLPADMGSLELAVRSIPSADGDLRLLATAHESGGQPVSLQTLAWEPLVPPADPRGSGFLRGRLDATMVASSFGTSALPAEGELRSRPITLKGIHAESGLVVVKLIGTDPRGRRIVAWAQLNGPGEAVKPLATIAH
jgi:hypothetical protein